MRAQTANNRPSVERARQGGQSATAVAPAPEPGRGLAVMVYDRDDNEVAVPLFADQGLPATFHGTLRQRFANQRAVVLRLFRDGALLGAVNLPMPPSPRGEPVKTTIEARADGSVRVELEHGERTVAREL